MPRKIELPNIDDLIRRYKAGETIEDLAKANGVSDSTVRRTLIQSGVRLRTQSEWQAIQRKPPLRTVLPDIAVLADRYRNGATLAELASEIGCCYAVIGRALRRHGVEIRGYHEARILAMKNMPEANRSVWKASISAANTGRKTSDETKVRVASVKFARQRHIREQEVIFADSIRDVLGFDVSQQFADGPYNIDIAISSHRVAVEIVSTAWSGRDKAKTLERTKYLLDRGWAVLFVVTYKRGLGRGPAFTYPAISIDAIVKNALPHINRVCGDESCRGKYGMIGSHGEPISAASGYLDGLPVIPGFEPTNKRTLNGRVRK